MLTPGDWGIEFGLRVFCAVAPWSRFQFVRFAADATAATTLRLLAECFEVLGGVVANRVIPTPDYVRFATHYRFRPDFCEAADPESKGIVEALISYAKTDLLVPLATLGDGPVTVEAANTAATAWCAEVNAGRPFADDGDPGRTAGHRTAGHRTGGARGAAVPGAADRAGTGAAHGGLAVVHPAGLGPLFGADPVHRLTRGG